MIMNSRLARVSRTFNRTVLYLAFIVFTILVLLPVYWMTRSAFAV
jgi:ABC-type glycerol-3-phosphate transport system permease component